MRLQSTSFQFGGAILSTDDPNFEHQIFRIVDLITLFLIQANSLLMELRVLIGLQTTIAQRTIDIMDAIVEAGDWLAGIVNDMAVWYQECDRRLQWYMLRWQLVPRGGIG